MGFLYMVAVSCSPAVSAASDDFSPPTTTST
jgi:vacuolar-type H+-ATPase catalytic subunit A/Vma1